MWTRLCLCLSPSYSCIVLVTISTPAFLIVDYQSRLFCLYCVAAKKSLPALSFNALIFPMYNLLPFKPSIYVSCSTSELRVGLEHRETGLSPPVKYFTDRSKAVLLLWIIFVISVLFLLCFRACLFIEASWSSAGKVLASWLSFVLSNCEVVTFPSVSWVRFGA